MTGKRRNVAWQTLMNTITIHRTARLERKLEQLEALFRRNSISQVEDVFFILLPLVVFMVKLSLRLINLEQQEDEI